MRQRPDLTMAWSTPDGRPHADTGSAMTLAPAAVAITVVRAGRVSIWPWWKHEHHQDSFWRIYRHDRGGAWLALAGRRRLDLPAGRVIVIPPGTAFSGRPAADVVQTYIHFTAALPVATSAKAFAGPLALPEDRTLSLLLDEITQGAPGSTPNAERTPLRLQAVATLALGLAVSVLPQATRDSLLSTIAPHEPIAHALAWIREHLQQPIMVADLELVTGLPRAKLNQAFQQRLEMTPARAIAAERLARAEALLIATTDSIDQIAEAAGYPGRFYLSRVFAKAHGCGPAAWRRHHHAP